MELPMSIFKELEPLVTVSYDEMEAYLYLPEPEADKKYTVRELEQLLADNGVTHGILEDKIQEIVDKKIYMKDVKVAEGTLTAPGEDGYFEYHFRRNLDNKPQVRPDGSVDYWNLSLIEAVTEGQVIAVYHPAVQGIDGVNVRGVTKPADRAREQQPLKGKGFTRLEDNLVYTASLTGKIEMKNDHINISPVYEIFGNVGVESGNVDFHGDVLIHGNVEAGMKVKATGTVTVDGVVEAAEVYAGRDIVLRGGVMGDSRAVIHSDNNIHAKFFEYSTVECLGDIDAEVFMASVVECYGQIVLNGRKARIIGGKVKAIKGIDCKEIGNGSEIVTEINVGVEIESYRHQQYLQKKISKEKDELEVAEVAEERFEEAQRQGRQIDISQKMALMRTRIKLESDLTSDKNELVKVSRMIEDGSRATVKVFSHVHPGVRIGIGDLRLDVKDRFQSIEFVKRVDKIIMRDIS